VEHQGAELRGVQAVGGGWLSRLLAIQRADPALSILKNIEEALTHCDQSMMWGALNA
jgi:hypothetical protein